tara:strand:+ start:3889 stop:4143 length:255 start_codon:yes stop_codon:yes gene_type:complete
MIKDIIVEQFSVPMFTVPIHSKNSGFDRFTENDDTIEEQDGGYISPKASLKSDGDDIRASMGGDPYGDVDIPDDSIYEDEEVEK